ncbi:MAG: hypothetical protein AB1589_02320 [Cyanobacteriota bacterium]
MKFLCHSYYLVNLAQFQGMSRAIVKRIEDAIPLSLLRYSPLTESFPRFQSGFPRAAKVNVRDSGATCSTFVRMTMPISEEWNGRCTLIDVPWLTGLSQGFFFGN